MTRFSVAMKAHAGALGISDLTKRRRQRQGERQKSKTTLHVHDAFCTFLRFLCTTTTWNDQILSLVENGNGTAINSTLSVWTRAPSPLFSSNQNSLLLSNRANWDNREKVSKDAKSIQRRFHGRRRCWIIRSLLTAGRKLL